MKVSTKYFGQINCEPEEKLYFPDGLFGFEEEKDFILLPFAGSGGSLLCLQSLNTPGLAFVAMDPFSLCGDYTPELREEEWKAIGASRCEELCFYVFCAVKEPVADSTVNLKCPVVIHPGTRRAMQVILETSKYEMRHRLSDLGTKEGAALC